MSTSSDIKIRKFSGRTEDFSAWRREFIAVMVLKKHIGLLKEKTKANAQKTFQNDFDDLNNEIYSLLIRALDNQNGAWLETKCESDGYTAWKFLLEKYDRRDPIKAASLRIELANIKMEEDGDIEDYLTEIKRLAYLISEGEGKQIQEEVICATIINGLPLSYESWIIEK